MKLSDLKQASQLVKRYGIKTIVYGMAGSGKTPLINTAPNPVMLATEPGLLSMRHSTIPVFQAETKKKAMEFFDWVFKSNETKVFDTIAVDSISNFAEIVLGVALNSNSHGMKAYGEMSDVVFDIVNKLYYLEDKHIVLLAKEGSKESGKTTTMIDGKIATVPTFQKIPYFPGKDLNMKIPYLFDNVFYLGKATVQGQPGQVSALRTKETDIIFARERTGILYELEPPNLTEIINKSLV